MRLPCLRWPFYFLLVVSVLWPGTLATEHVTENVRAEGTISAGAAEDFVVTSQVDWNTVEWLSGRGKQEEPSVIATLTLSCADITKSTFLL